MYQVHIRRIMWYPKGKREHIERLLSKLLELEREDKITIWQDQDENGKWFYDIRKTETIEPE